MERKPEAERLRWSPSATLLDTGFCIRLSYVARGVTQSAGQTSRCRWRDGLASKPTTLESQERNEGMAEGRRPHFNFQDALVPNGAARFAFKCPDDRQIRLTQPTLRNAPWIAPPMM